MVKEYNTQHRLKRAMECQWLRRPTALNNHVCQWSEYSLERVNPALGRACKTQNNANLKEIQKWSGNYCHGLPLPKVPYGRGKLTPSKKWVEKVKNECPRNAKALIALYGENNNKTEGPFPPGYRPLFWWVYYGYEGVTFTHFHHHNPRKPDNPLSLREGWEYWDNDQNV